MQVYAGTLKNEIKKKVSQSFCETFLVEETIC